MSDNILPRYAKDISVLKICVQYLRGCHNCEILDPIVREYHDSHACCGGKEELAAREPVKILTENSRPKLIKLAELCCPGTFVAPAGIHFE